MRFQNFSPKNYDQWVLWEYRLRGGQQTKVPVDLSGQPVSVTALESYYSYNEVKDHDKIGFCLTVDDPFFCIDLDHCISKDGHVTTLASDLVMKFCDTYQEFSPSGQGLHIWGKGFSGPGRRGNGIEIYSQDRFITFTGQPLLDLPVVDCQRELDELLSNLGHEVKLRDETIKEVIKKVDIPKTIEKLRHIYKTNPSFRRLWQLKTKFYKSDGKTLDYSAYDIRVANLLWHLPLPEIAFAIAFFREKHNFPRKNQRAIVITASKSKTKGETQ